MNAIDFTAGLIAALSGGFLAFQFGFSFNYWLSFISSILAVAFSFLLREPSKHNVKTKEVSFHHIVITAFSFFRANISALKICINAILISACIVYIDEFWQLYLEHIAFSVIYFGIISSIICGGRILGSILSARLLRYFKLTSILVSASFLCAFGIVMASIIGSIVGALGLVLAISMAALIEPLVMGYLHHHADHEARATIESISSLIERIFSIVLGLFFGFVATNFGIMAGFWLIGIFINIIAVIFLFVYHSKKFLYK
jgi:Major Facilitator Superfamily.